jgi:hypothetical protein
MDRAAKNSSTALDKKSQAQHRHGALTIAFGCLCHLLLRLCGGLQLLQGTHAAHQIEKAPTQPAQCLQLFAAAGACRLAQNNHK